MRKFWNLVFNTPRTAFCSTTRNYKVTLNGLGKSLTKEEIRNQIISINEIRLNRLSREHSQSICHVSLSSVLDLKSLRSKLENISTLGPKLKIRIKQIEDNYELYAKTLGKSDDFTSVNLLEYIDTVLDRNPTMNNTHTKHLKESIQAGKTLIGSYRHKRQFFHWEYQVDLHKQNLTKKRVIQSVHKLMPIKSYSHLENEIDAGDSLHSVKAGLKELLAIFEDLISKMLYSPFLRQGDSIWKVLSIQHYKGSWSVFIVINPEYLNLEDVRDIKKAIELQFDSKVDFLSIGFSTELSPLVHTTHKVLTLKSKQSDIPLSPYIQYDCFLEYLDRMMPLSERFDEMIDFSGVGRLVNYNFDRVICFDKVFPVLFIQDFQEVFKPIGFSKSGVYFDLARLKESSEDCSRLCVLSISDLMGLTQDKARPIRRILYRKGSYVLYTRSLNQMIDFMRFYSSIDYLVNIRAIFRVLDRELDVEVYIMHVVI